MQAHHLAATLALTAALVAQNQELGFDDGWNTTFTDRVGAANIDADVLNHFDNRNLVDWMLDPADLTGATFTCRGCRLVTQDQVGTTAASFNIVGYAESTSTPDIPGAIWFRTGPINLPASTATGPVAWIWTINFTPPGTPKGDVFLGAGLALSTPAWPTDGLSVHCAFNGATGDNPGPGAATILNGNLACYMPTAASVPVPPAIFPPGGATGLRQIRFEVIAGVSAGVAVTQTNQTSYPSSNAGALNSTPLGGTTNWLSGVHPNVYDAFSSSPARQDDIGFLYKDPALANAPVFVILAFGPSPIGSTPLQTLSPLVGNPATRGNVCVDFVGGETFLNIADGTGVVHLMLPTLSPATRAVIQSFAPFDLWWQGFGLNALAGGPPFEVHASGCAIQHL